MPPRGGGPAPPRAGGGSGQDDPAPAVDALGDGGGGPLDAVDRVGGQVALLDGVAEGCRTLPPAPTRPLTYQASL